MRKRLSMLLIVYLIIGLFFAISFALYYHWAPLAYFSPGFYGVVFTWPLQIPGFLRDGLYYGWGGKPI